LGCEKIRFSVARTANHEGALVLGMRARGVLVWNDHERVEF